MRPIFSLFEKIRQEKIKRQKDHILFCAANIHAVTFCYVAKQNNFNVDAVLPLQVKKDDLVDYSGVPAVQDIPETERTRYLVVLMLTYPQKVLEHIFSLIAKSGYDAILLLNDNDVRMFTSEMNNHSYFSDQLDKLLVMGFWNKQIFLLGLNQFTPIILNTMRMRGYILSGIISDENSSENEKLYYEKIPLVSAKSVMEQKNCLIIEVPPFNARYAQLREKHFCWQLSLVDLQMMIYYWNFLSTFYNILNLETPCENLEYEKKAREILSAYEHVTICFIDTERIGNMMETLVFVNQREDRKNLYALIPRYNQYGKRITFGSDQTANNFLLSKIREVCPVITNDQNDFWRYFIKNHAHAVNYTNEFSHFYMRMKQIEKNSHDDYYVGEPPIVFSDEEESLGQQKMANMGITGEYVTFFARGNTYLKTTFGENFVNASHTVRNSSIQNFSLTCQKLYEKGFQTVRMGYLVEGSISGDGIIDYANNYREEFLDYYLIARSKFFVCGFCGLAPVAMLFHVPVVYVNITSITLNGDIACHKTNRNPIILLPKKLFDSKRQRFITLTEQLKLEKQIPNIYKRVDYFKMCGFEYIENTPEEIWDAAEEMLLRLEGKFQYTSHAQELQERFKSALNDATKQNPNIIPVGTTISSKFLMKNPQLVM